MNNISFAISQDDFPKLKRLADRVCATWPEFDRMTLVMDLQATHANGCPLDFDKMLKADDFNLAHDAFGIANHIDRTTGKLTDCFLPRCSKHDEG
jgi:hypothetical protein